MTRAGRFTAALALLTQAAAAGAPAVFEPVCVDDAVPGYATFQSHNQKVVSNANGIFLTYIRTRNQEYTAQTWRLMRSVDGGRTFSAVHEAVHATNPPVIETDAEGNIHLVRADFVDGNAYYYRFHAGRDYRDPEVVTVPGGAAGKYALMLDEPRGQLYFFSHNDSFHIIGLDGAVRRSFDLLRAGEHGVLQYPLLALAGNGELFAAWTTQKHGVYLYWDVHAMRSPDAAATWRDLAGSPVAPPVVADETGPATRVSLDDEFESHTWLSNFLVKGGKLHFMYLAQTEPRRQHYARYDAGSGQCDTRISPEFRGENLRIQSLDGFFASSPEGPLFAVGSDGGRVVCLASADNGATWHDHAHGAGTYNVYALGGCRAVTLDGHILGTFTDQSGSNASEERSSRLFFIRIPAAPDTSVGLAGP